MILSGDELQKLKSKYCRRVVGGMSDEQCRSYLVGIVFNDCVRDSGEDMEKRILRIFGEDIYNELIEEVTGTLPKELSPGLTE